MKTHNTPSLLALLLINSAVSSAGSSPALKGGRCFMRYDHLSETGNNIGITGAKFLASIFIGATAWFGMLFPSFSQPFPTIPFEVSTDYLTKHDIVYLSPTQLEAEGFPMGNGNVGGMIWNHDTGIEIQVNKNDLWTSPNPLEGNTSILKHAARIKVDFGFPVFSWIHLKDFEGRLSLQNGEVTYKAGTAFSSTKIRTWLAHNSNIWVIECENIPNLNFFADSIVSTVSAERIGSRAFAGWYGGWFAKDAATGIGKTHAAVRGKDILLEENGNGLDFAVACRIINGNSSPAEISSHRAQLGTKHSNFTILLSIATKKEFANPSEKAIELLNQAEFKTVQKLKKEKDDWHRNFWSRSFLKIGDDYLENIYYLRRYLMGAGSQGQYPVCFNGGLWRWNRDVMNWVTPHHWNTQQQYWGLCAQNDVELMKPYINAYFKMIPFAEALAKERGAQDALLITEAHDFDGHQVSKNWNNMEKNYTPASQIASLFWDYYEFSGKPVFLRDTAYVFMKGAANFYLDRLQWDSARNEYYLKSSLYESEEIDEAKNSISDRACIEALLKNCIKAASILAVDSDKIEKWRHVLKHLWKIQIEPFEKYGPLIVPAEEYFSEKKYTPYSWACGGVIAFPAGLIGIREKDTELGKAVVNLIKGQDNANAHYPLPIIAARMGMGDQSLTYLLNGVKTHQMYPQGLMHNVTGYPDNIYNLQSIHDLLNGKHKIRSQAFFQCGMEPISNYATALNEMLLQSNEGMIRVFPAIPKKWEKSIGFKLLARGGFLVSSVRDSAGNIPQINILSVNGSLCKIKNPWPGKKVSVYATTDSKKIPVTQDRDDVFSFKTKRGTDYAVLPKDARVPHTPLTFSSTKNMRPKRLGNRILGKESGWNDE